MRTQKTPSRRSGLVAVETALVLPILFLIVMGLIEGSNAAYSWMTVQKAAQIGARFASTGRGSDDGSRLTQILDATKDSLVALDIASCEIKVRSWPDLSASGDGIDNDPGAPCQLAEVSVLYSYKPFTPLVGALLPETIPLYGSDRKVNEPWKPCD